MASVVRIVGGRREGLGDGGKKVEKRAGSCHRWVGGGLPGDEAEKKEDGKNSGT